MHTSSVSAGGRQYPLRDTILNAWKRLGLAQVSDANNGAPQGIGWWRIGEMVYAN